ncbi:hypothetical protein BO71DRAFT_428583 [Aspergillus ellipticus CBS 707.79]|uniref:3-hydroxyacyl-CoA dehydrogenase C-terminal domain-containing protein n=1 Tax=Aspergillus ellipticus CBS 707.79 TaxID=1448320 RepID=A0A319DF15_9EURO|nr:hypothetical protein BO71DRAFT_428583 [Aspergillus ellipticus CBS 707.79]
MELSKHSPAPSEVEIVPHPATGDEYVTAAHNFYRSGDKDPVVVRRETPGFIANRLQAAVCAEAYSLISRGIVSPEDMDKTITSGLGLRWALLGPIMTNTLGGGGDFGHLSIIWGRLCNHGWMTCTGIGSILTLNKIPMLSRTQ